VAVLAVLAFHAAVPHLAGGFVGVDVFFVVSGYLITGQLVASLRVTGAVSLRDFYARRARRIIPSAAVVLVAVVVAAQALLAPLRRADVAGDVLAAALQVPNWRFVAQQVDYLAESRDISPVLHYWSLGVEEQFYLVWPALLVAAWWLARRRGATSGIRGVAVALGAVVVGSFAVSLYWTEVDKPWAYLGTPARMWQFAVGGLAALLPVLLPALLPVPEVAGPAAPDVGPAAPAPARSWWRPWLAWSGLTAVGWAVVALDGRTSYPGWASVLPTLGTAAVLLAGGPRPLRSAPAQAIGGLSYTWYLWHWPVLVFADAAAGHPLPWPAKAVLVTASALPAWLTTRWVERPIRFSTALRRVPARSFAVAGVSVLTALAVGLVGQVAAAAQLRQPVVAGAVHPAGAVDRAGAVDPAADPFGADPRTSGPVAPAPADARADGPHYPRGCNLEAPEISSPRCLMSPVRDVPDDDRVPRRPHVVLLGDSHAGQWFGAVGGLAARHGWDTEILVKGGCPLPEIGVFNASLGRAFTECDRWRDATLRRIWSEPAPVMIFMATMDRYPADPAAVRLGWQQVLAHLAGHGVPVVYLRDTPFPGIDVPDCVSGALADWTRCAFDRAAALPADPMADGIAAGYVRDVVLVDVTDVLCPPAAPRCPAVRGGTVLYRDSSHVSDTAMKALVPRLEAELHRHRLV